MTRPTPHQPNPAWADRDAALEGEPSLQELQRALVRPTRPVKAGARPGPVALAALIAVAAVVALGAAMARQHVGAPSVTAAPAPATQELPAAGSGADGGTPDGASGETGGGAKDGSADSDLLVAPPQGVLWELFEGVAVPTSRTDGPSRVDGPVHSGFSRTPTGALLAAAQIGVRRIVTPDINDLRAVNEQQLLPGPGRTAFLNLIASQQDNAPPAGGYAQYAGFQLLSFTSDVAVLNLVTRSPRGVLQASTDTLHWAGGDWKVQLPPSGLEQPRVLTDLAGFVPWSGVSR